MDPRTWAIVLLYRELRSTYAVADAMKMNQSTVWRRLVAAGEPREPVGRPCARGRRVA